HYDVAANASWTESESANHTIMAWDISVIKEEGGVEALVPGRVYANVMNHYVSGPYYGVQYVLTKDGYIYRINNNGQDGLGFTFFANNKGVVEGTDGKDDTAAPRYRSVVGNGASIWDPRQLDGDETI